MISCRQNNVLDRPAQRNIQIILKIMKALEMDPGSKSPRELGDVRDDVCSVLRPMSYALFRACPGIQTGRNSLLTTTQSHTHVIPGLPRNPDLFLSWIPDQCHLASSVTSGMTYVLLFRPMSYTSFRACPGIQSLSPPPPHAAVDARSSLDASLPDNPFLRNHYNP